MPDSYVMIISLFSEFKPSDGFTCNKTQILQGMKEVTKDKLLFKEATDHQIEFVLDMLETMSFSKYEDPDQPLFFMLPYAKIMFDKHVSNRLSKQDREIMKQASLDLLSKIKYDVTPDVGALTDVLPKE